jgi:hypothetical protein
VIEVLVCPTATRKVQLAVGTKSTGGQALVFRASAVKAIASHRGGLYALELHGIDASLDPAPFIDQDRCVGGHTCEWTVVPDKAGGYEYRAFLLDYAHHTAVGESNTVRVRWPAPPRRKAIAFLPTTAASLSRRWPRR